ncbi:MAG: hypothetical protein ACYC5Y_15195 [Symbiobacteriia bacterium]
MELSEIRQALSMLPPESAAQLLRELLDRTPALAPTPSEWTAGAQRIIQHYEEALKRLAK